MSISNFLKKTAFNFLKDSIEEAPNVGREIIQRVRVEIWRFEKRLIKSLMAGFILLLSFAVLSLSFIFFLIEYLHFTKTLSLLIVGIILLIVGIILKI
jgi:cell division protein FtsL